LRLMEDSVWESLLDRYGLETASGQVSHPYSLESRR
jgi:hypothetical protein